MARANNEANSVLANPNVSDVLEQLKKREPIFHRPELGTTRADFDQMMDEAFCEVGASGRRYDREYVLDELEKRHANPIDDEWEALDFRYIEIAPDNYLLTYTLIQGERVTRRSTIWRRTSGGWKILYHQGTIVESH